MLDKKQDCKSPISWFFHYSTTPPCLAVALAKEDTPLLQKNTLENLYCEPPLGVNQSQVLGRWNLYIDEVKPLQIHVELLVPYNRIAKTKSVEVETEGDTLDKLLEALIRRIPALENHLTGEEVPGASPFLLLINGKVVPVEKPSEIFLKPEDRVGFMRIVTGG